MVVDPSIQLIDIAAGLQYLHTHELGPIIHNDINGSNVFVSDDHRALLAGFDCSTLAENSPSGVDADPRPRGGTFRWMSPEILEDSDPSIASDVWAFGMTLLCPAPPEVEVDPLEEVCRQAAKFSINLNGQVYVDIGQVPKVGGSAFVYRGILHRDGGETAVAVKTFHSAPRNDMNALGVMSGLL
ncbi:hypothetical protein ID866_9453 [Astraeus odoratus]|nr:hypothetical protein ID866_9453 [Astraeus odoratus]